MAYKPNVNKFLTGVLEEAARQRSANSHAYETRFSKEPEDVARRQDGLKSIQRIFTNSGLCDILSGLRSAGLHVEVTQQSNFRGAKGRPRPGFSVHYSGKPVIEAIVADSGRHFSRAVRMQISEQDIKCGENLEDYQDLRIRDAHDIPMSSVKDVKAILERLKPASIHMLATMSHIPDSGFSHYLRRVSLQERETEIYGAQAVPLRPDF